MNDGHQQQRPIQPTDTQRTRRMPSNEELAAELHARDVNFLRGGRNSTSSCGLHPTMLIAALAASHEARLRLALIPLLLRRPELGEHADLSLLSAPMERVTLMCYYTAAWLLQQKYQKRLTTIMGEHAPLPDLYTTELEIVPFPSPDAGLRKLAARHAILSRKSINWLGTYEHAAQRWLAHLEQRKQWQT